MHDSSSNQEYVHQDKKSKLIVILNRIWGMSIFFQHNDFNHYHSSVQVDNQLSPIFDFIFLNQQSEFNNRIKNTIKMKHNLAEIDLLKILHDLKVQSQHMILL